MVRSFIFGLIVFVLVKFAVADPVAYQKDDIKDFQPADPLVDFLNLTTEQSEQLQAILKAKQEKELALRREIHREMRLMEEETIEELSKVLSSDQLEDYLMFTERKNPPPQPQQFGFAQGRGQPMPQRQIPPPPPQGQDPFMGRNNPNPMLGFQSFPPPPPPGHMMGRAF